MQKILVLTSTFPRWQHDVEPPFVFDLCKRLADEFDVYVVAPHAQNALEQEIMDNIHVVRFRYCFERFETLCYEGGILARLRAQPLRYLLIPFFLAFQLLEAHRLIKLKNINIIHAHWIIPQGIIACILRYFTKQKLNILCTSHGGDLFSLNGKIFRFIKRKILLNIDAVSVVSPIMAEEVYSLCQPLKPTLSIIPMGIDFENIFIQSSAEKKPFSLLFVGRLVTKKGVDFLINAMPAIVKEFPQAQLTIVGDGPEKDNLKNLSTSLNLQKYIDFKGSILNSELPAYYQKSLIAIFPFIVADNGDREGLGLVIPEAIGCGCCVVTTNLPGMTDLITHEHTGFIVEQKNSSAIAAEVIHLFNNPEKIRKVHSTAYQDMTAKLDVSAISQKYINLIQSIT